MQIRTAGATAMLALTLGCAQKPAAPPQMPPASVELADVKTANVQDSSDYVATLKSLHATPVQPQTDGQITDVYVKAGDRVAAGAKIAQIDPRRQAAAVTSLEASRASRLAALNLAKQDLQRAQQLYAAGAISKQALDQAQTAVETAQADVNSLGAQVQQQQEQLRYYTVTAPVAGVVGDVPMRVGNQVTTSTMLTTITDDRTLELNVSVPVERARDLRPGLPIEIWSSDGQQKLADSTITFISPQVDATTQAVLVKGSVSNPSGALRADEEVRARVVWKTSPGIVIPITAVLRINGQYFAFVAEQDNGKLVARQRPITVGPIVGNDYAVLTGLKAGDRIVVSGTQRLNDGAPIAPVK